MLSGKLTHTTAIRVSSTVPPRQGLGLSSSAQYLQRQSRPATREWSLMLKWAWDINIDAAAIGPWMQT